MVSQKEIDIIYRCYYNRYKSMDCLQCEMNYLCEAWRQKDGANPLTMKLISPELPTPSAKFPELTARTVA